MTLVDHRLHCQQYHFHIPSKGWPRKSSQRIRHPRKPEKGVGKSITPPTLDYPVNVINQLMGNWADSTHKREIALAELGKMLSTPGLIDGINPIFEPLTLDSVRDGLAELQKRGTVRSIREGRIEF